MKTKDKESKKVEGVTGKEELILTSIPIILFFGVMVWVISKIA